MNNSNPSKSVLCFVDGEPHLYDKELEKYIKLELDYDATLISLKNKLKDALKRPTLKEIWKILATVIVGCKNYCSNCNKKTSNKDISDSFENKMTREISSFLDLKFARLTEKEKEERRKTQKELNELNYSLSDSIYKMTLITGTHPQKKIRKK